MKRLLIVAVWLSAANAFAQNVPGKAAVTTAKTNIPHAQNKTSKDTTVKKDSTEINKEPRYFYLSANANVFVNTKGGFSKRFSPSIEFGRTYGIFDIGLATGRFNFLSQGSDTSHYIEFRPTINIFSKGRFAEALCLGGGYVFKGKQGLMSEICNSINFNVTSVVAIAVVQGYFFFDGTNNSRATQYMGFNLTYNFLPRNTINRLRKHRAILDDK